MTTLPAGWIVKAYACPDPLPGFECVAHWFKPEKDSHGKTAPRCQVATVYAPRMNEAAEQLTAFLINEIERERRARENVDKRVAAAAGRHR